MSDFTKLKVWQEAQRLTLQIYKLTSDLPREEVFGLMSQLRRAAVSVGSNIAEGESRYTTKDKLNFFIQARSSVAEIESQLYLLGELYKSLSDLSLQIRESYEELAKQINSLISYRRKHHDKT